MQALYYGSFDPFTNGHLDVLSQAVNIFDTVYVALLPNPKKIRRVPELTVKKFLQSYFADVENVYFYIGEYKTAFQIGRELGVDYFVRGIRNNGIDYNYEESNAAFNYKWSNINTLFIRPKEFCDVSSTLVWYLLENGLIDLAREYIPDGLFRLLEV